MTMRDSLWKACFLLLAAISLFDASCGKKDLEPTPPESERPASTTRPAPQFKAVSGTGENIQEASLINQILPQLHSRLEIRTLIVQAGKPVILPVQYEGILELRAGSVTTGGEKNRQAHRRGDIWQVAKGERVTLQASGELAVLQAVYLVPGER
jgi:hypothetical protein